MTEKCPNCRQRGHADIAAAESGSEYDTWMCDNQNCRVARYYVKSDAAATSEVKSE